MYTTIDLMALVEDLANRLEEHPDIEEVRFSVNYDGYCDMEYKLHDIVGLYATPSVEKLVEEVYCELTALGLWGGFPTNCYGLW